MSVSRRAFLGSAAAVAASATLPRDLEARLLPSLQRARSTAPTPPATPVVIASANGLRGVARAHDLLTGGADTLDAIIAGVNIQELDPDDQSVGLGGLPNENGIVQLDASCMHGATNRAGAVGALEGIATPSLVAKAVMEYTDHIMLVGEGAKRFALAQGFEETNLLTERSRQDWMRWKARLNGGDNWLDREDEVAVAFTTGTINMNAVDANGDLSSVTTTSGLSWKIPGRVGDSPILGAGQYCDNRVGAAGSTGRGEANMKACGAFLTVEFMRQGQSPEQACLSTLERVVSMTEARLLDDRGRPRFGLSYYALAKDGRVGAASLYQGGQYAVADGDGARLLDFAYLYPRSERPA